MVDGVGELGAALLLKAVELEQNASSLRDGHENDDQDLQLL